MDTVTLGVIIGMSATIIAGVIGIIKIAMSLQKVLSQIEVLIKTNDQWDKRFKEIECKMELVKDECTKNNTDISNMKEDINRQRDRLETVATAYLKA